MHDAIAVNYVAEPTPARFHADDSFVRGLIGPVGSGKSVACSLEILARALRQAPAPDGFRRSRWAVIRNSYPEIGSTTIRTWHDWMREPWCKTTMSAAPISSIVSAPLGDGTKIEMEVLFLSLDRPDDAKKLLSLELTGAWVNEAREIPRAIVDMLQARVGRYPAMRDGGPTWSGLIMDTNPPDTDHWWYRLFEEERPAGWRLFKQPSGRSPEAENLENLLPGYYDRIAGGKDEAWIRIYVDGEYGFVIDGKPVYPEFRTNLHVAEKPIRFNPKARVYVGIDFGLTPAAALIQRDALGRWAGIHEVVTEDMGAVRFAELLAAELQQVCPEAEIELWGDPAGDQRSQVDERTPFQILRAKGLDVRPAPGNNDFELRREAVVQPLTRIVDGKPGLILSPSMKVAVKGMTGGYCYRRLKVSGDERYHDKPEKSRFSHVCEGLQYALLGSGEGRPLVGRRVPVKDLMPPGLDHGAREFDRNSWLAN